MDTSVRNVSERTVLYVDDDALLRQMMARVMRIPYPSFKLIVAENGYEALDKIAEHSPDLIILDYCMPEMDGYQLSEKILANNSNSRIIVLSGYLNSYIKGQFTSIGINTFIEKPFEREDLYKAVDSLCCD